MQVKSSTSCRSLVSPVNRSRGLKSRLKINCVETKIISEPMNFSDLNGRISS